MISSRPCDEVSNKLRHGDDSFQRMLSHNDVQLLNGTADTCISMGGALHRPTTSHRSMETRETSDAVAKIERVAVITGRKAFSSFGLRYR